MNQDDLTKARKEHQCSRHGYYHNCESYTIKKGELYENITAICNGRYMSIEKLCVNCIDIYWRGGISNSRCI